MRDITGNYLDNVRLSEGALKCRDLFRETARHSKIRAAALLNNRNLKYPCLFALRQELDTPELKNMLNPRNKTALEITEHILVNEPESASLKSKNAAEYSALKWILETGHIEDGLSGEFDMVLDTSASVLINTYKDLDTLPLAADIIFKRCREGRNIHNLVWAFFRVRDPYALRLIAQHIRSSDPKEREFALMLLDLEAVTDNDVQYSSFINWLKENDPYLYFTGESFQATSEPVFFSIDSERKYLNQPVTSRGAPGPKVYEMQPAVPVSSMEHKSLEVFKTLSGEDQALLSDYSHALRKENASEWKKWMRYPVDIQIKTALARREKQNDQNN